MNSKISKIIIRISDQEKFILQKNGKYSMEIMLSFKEKDHLIGEWTLKNLSNPKYFKVDENY